MHTTRVTPEFKEALIHGEFANGEPACLELVFGGTPDSLWVDIKVVRKRDRLPLVEVARVHGIQAGNTVTLEDIANAFNVGLTTR